MNFKNVNVEGFRVPTGQHTAAGQEEFDHEALRTKLQVAWRFTQTYKQYQNAPVAIREAHCLAEQYPALRAEGFISDNPELALSL